MATGSSGALVDEQTKRDAVMRYLRAAAANSRAGVRERPAPPPVNPNPRNELARQAVISAAANPGQGIGSRILEEIVGTPFNLMEAAGLIGGSMETNALGGPDPLSMGNTLADVGVEMGQETLKDWSDPVGYFERNPGYALMDLIGLAAGGAGLLRKGVASAAARAGVSPSDFLSSEVGAIGPVGKRLEIGDVGEITSLRPFADDPSFGDLIGSSAASPDLGSMRYPDDPTNYPVLLKRIDPAGNDVFGAQGNAELTANELNRLSGGNVHMPGMAEARGPYTPWYQKGDNPAGTREGEDLAVVEFAVGSRKAEGLHDLTPSPQTIHDLRAMQIFDRVVGNRDRGWGHNIMATAEGRPLAIDYGLAFQAMDDWQMGFFDPRVWGAMAGPETAGLRMGQLAPSEIDWLQRIKHVLEHPNATMVGGSSSQGLGAAAHRAHKMIESGEFTSYGPGGWGRNFTRKTSMPREVFEGRKLGEAAPAPAQRNRGWFDAPEPSSRVRTSDVGDEDLFDMDDVDLETQDREWQDWAIANPTEAELLEAIANAPAPDVARLPLPAGMRRSGGGGPMGEAAQHPAMGMVDLDFDGQLVVFDGFEWQRLNEIDLRMIAEGDTPPWFAAGGHGETTSNLRAQVGGGDALANILERQAQEPLASPSPAPGASTRARHQEELAQVIQELIERNRQSTGTSTLWNKIVQDVPEAPGLGIMDATALLDAIRRASESS